ncbi:nucleoside recognition domain-containing protein [Roseibium sp. SCP14]|uniref:nucleoside recognition domain-containing protein n=1 Tax=Roseibium sp. SCP14 TaxID=3141375 RepID=UPI00333A4DD0
MARIMVPIMIIMRLADTYGVIDWMSPAMQPVMALLNLPPEAAIVCLTAILTGLYGAIATLPVLIGQELTAAQITSICTFMLIAHALPVEQAIVRKAGGSFWGTVFLRLFAACLAVLLIDAGSKVTGYLSEPQSLDHFKEFARVDAGHMDWALSSLKGMVLLFIILAGLLVMMDAFDRFGVTAVFNRLFAPVMHLSGLDRSVTSITTAGILLGLAYGGGLIIARGNDPAISHKARYYALCWLSLCHGLIEDVALMVAIGGDFWVLFFGRLILTLFLVRGLMLWHRLRKKEILATT